MGRQRLILAASSEAHLDLGIPAREDVDFLVDSVPDNDVVMTIRFRGDLHCRCNAILAGLCLDLKVSLRIRFALVDHHPSSWRLETHRRLGDGSLLRFNATLGPVLHADAL